MTRDQDACGLVQVRHTVPGSILYQSYWYRSGVNQTMTRNLHGIARAVEDLTGLSAGDLVVDIGCNDGTLFDGYEARDVRFLGFDPSDQTRYAVEEGLRRGARLLQRAGAGPALRRPPREGDHQHRDVLRPGGPGRVRARRGGRPRGGRRVGDGAALPAADAPAQRLRRDRARAPGVLLAGGAGAAVRGGRSGGHRRGAQRHQRRLDPAVHRPRRPARGLGRRPPTGCRTCGSGSSRWRWTRPRPTSSSPATWSSCATSCASLCESIVAEGKTIHVYGASTKGNTILQYADLDRSLISHAADRNPDKWGSETRTGIPVISEEDSRAMRPDYYLVLPWHFLDEFLERERALPRGRRQLHRAAARGPRDRCRNRSGDRGRGAHPLAQLSPRAVAGGRLPAGRLATEPVDEERARGRAPGRGAARQPGAE